MEFPKPDAAASEHISLQRPDNEAHSRPRGSTDNFSDYAWAAIDSQAARAAQDYLESASFVRIDAPEGTYLTRPNQQSFADDEGYGQTYLFTTTDVRYATTKAEVASVKAPDEVG